MRNYLGTIAIILYGFPVSLTYACGQHGTNAGNGLWLPTNSGGGVIQGLLSLEVSLVAPTVPTTCTAGIGLGSLDNLAPSGLTVSGMSIIVLNNKTGNRVPLPEFSFRRNSITTTGLTVGSVPSDPPNTNPLFDGSVWFGFASDVAPFTPPVLGPDEILAFQFAVEIPLLQLPFSLESQYAGGEGRADGMPIFDGAHPVQYFTATDPLILFTVPEPSSLAMVGLIGLILMSRRSGVIERPW